MKAIIAGLGLVVVGLFVYFVLDRSDTGSAVNTVAVNDGSLSHNSTSNAWGGDGGNDADPDTDVVSFTTTSMSGVTVFISDRVDLPLPGSAPTTNVKHTIDVTEIRRGCFRQDCIPSVDKPEFISVSEASDILPPDSIGIALSYQGETRFYPFPMLETHELVNDFVGGEPVLVSYCPLCGTGIVFDRRVGGEAAEFGVSGMLWQSNLLMYNRAENLSDRNLWSQVLGQAVVGERAGEQLTIIPSDIVRFSDWKDDHQDALVLTTGTPRDPYGGDYFRVASSFAPDFDASTSPLSPTEYVYGIKVNDTFKAYVRDQLPVGITTDVVAGETVSLNKSEDGTVVISTENGVLPDVEGFWFSWVSAHPDTLLYVK